MYPLAVDGRMPFVDQKTYREQQIKKVIQKHRAKRHRDSIPEKYSLQKNKHSFRNTTKSSAMSLLDERDPFQCDLISTSNNLASSTDTIQKFSKSNILYAIKQWFTKTKHDQSRGTPYQPRFQQKGARNRSFSAPIDYNLSHSRKTSLNSNSPPSVSPKRQRTRTVSNISSVMETIEEIPECFILDDGSDTDTESDYASCRFGSTGSSLDELLVDANPSGQFSSQSKSIDSLLNCSDVGQSAELQAGS